MFFLFSNKLLLHETVLINKKCSCFHILKIVLHIYCAAVECNGCQAEEQTGGLQEVPQPEVLPEQSTSDFDFNEFFNLEKTMPGLASVSAGVHQV